MNKKEIQYKNTEKFTPEVIDEVLEVKETYGLTAENVLRKASKKSSSLYEFFDWDNSSASEKWRLHQARLFINEIKIIVEDKEIYAFENVKISISDLTEDTEDTKQKKSGKFPIREYVSKIDVLNNEDYRKQLIHRALAEADYWKERHAELVELESIFNSIETEKKKWQKNKK